MFCVLTALLKGFARNACFQKNSSWTTDKISVMTVEKSADA